MTRDTRTFAIVLVCFLLSGVAALLYQTVWMRYFSILFGTSELAVVTVLMAYMGGLALGAAVIGRVIDRLQRPVLLYALLEFGIAISAALVPLALHLVRSLRAAVLGGLPELPGSMGFGQGFFYLAAGFIILMIPTAFMGATLPLLAKGVVLSREDIGKRIGLLYATNTLGAIVGTLAAAFFLIPALGLRLTAASGIALNIVAGLLGLLAARAMRPNNATPPPSGTSTDTKPSPLAPRASKRVTRILLPLMLISGALSFAYEVLWTRLLGIVVGGSMTAFATMLAGFLLGITLGSAAASRFARNPNASARGLALAQAGTGLLSVAVFYLLATIPDWATSLREHGWSTTTATALCSIAVLLPSTLCIGATFPFAVRVLSTEPANAARAAARIYSWNTVGAIAGAFLAGFLLIPALGFAGMIALAATGNLILALTAYTLTENTNRNVVVAGAVIALAVALLFRPDPPMEILSANRLQDRAQSEKTSSIRFYEVGRSATVVTVENMGNFYLKTNGLPEATISRAGARIHPHNETWMMATLPCLANLSAESMLVIGLGGGQVLSGVPPKIKSIDVVELEEAVVTANRELAPDRLHDPLKDPRVNLVVNDARNALGLTAKKYDIIVSQPSHPWTAGASHLYTREFLREAAARLNPDGVFLQWIGTAFIDDALARSLLATFTDVFPSVRVHSVQEDLIILGSTGRMDTLQDLCDSAAEDGTILHHSGWAGLRTPEDVAATLVLDEEAVARFCAGAPLSTDDNNRMAVHSPRLIDFKEHTLAKKGYHAWRDHDSYLHGNLLANLSAVPAWSNPHLLWKIHRSGNRERYNALLEKLDPMEAALARGFTAVDREDFPAALAAFNEVLKSDPENRAALFYVTYSLLRLMPIAPDRRTLFIETSQAANLPGLEKLFQEYAAQLTEDERTQIAALFHGATAQWDAVRAADARLEETLTPRNLLYGLLTVQRARALLQGANNSEWDTAQRRAAAKKALGHLNRALDNGFSDYPILELRGRAAAIAGREPEFINTIWSCLRAALSEENPGSPIAQQNLQSVSRLMQQFVPTDASARSPAIKKLITEIDTFADQLDSSSPSGPRRGTR